MKKRNCEMCGAPASEVHHLIFGRGLRELSERYGLTMSLCRKCHRNIHNTKPLMRWSRQYGQKKFEEKYTREEFISIFGKNWL